MGIDKRTRLGIPPTSYISNHKVIAQSFEISIIDCVCSDWSNFHISHSLVIELSLLNKIHFSSWRSGEYLTQGSEPLLVTQ